MTTVIKSGSSGNTADVDSFNRIQTFSVTESDKVFSSLSGETFFISSKNIELTSANMSFLVYIQNTDTTDWIVTDLNQSYSLSTGGPGGFVQNQFHLDPTGGTLLSGGTPSGALNMNTGSSKTLTANIITGSEGATATGGVEVPKGMIHRDQSRILFAGGPIVIARGTSMAFGVQPPAGNTSMQAKVDFIIYRKVDA